MGHAVLLGDSIFDNELYVSGGEPIVEQLRSRLPREWRVSLLARDGAVTTDVLLKQLQKIPPDASHLIVSAGGNNALQGSPILNSPTPDAVAMLEELVTLQSEFQESYRRMIRAIRERRLPVFACTIYDAVPGLRPIERMGLSLFNDVIMRELFACHVPVLDLRSVCNESRDYSTVSPIEPSEIGGSKIARAIQSVLLGHNFSRPETVVFP